MLALLAPAKKMDFDSELVIPDAVKKHFAPELTEKLVLLARSMNIEDVKKLMKVSDSLAESTCKNFNEFSFSDKTGRTRPAAFAFKGETYKGLSIDLLNKEDLVFAETSIRILSGLYGVLSPLTLIEPYRFEMGLRFEVGGFKKISDFWKIAVTNELNRLLKERDEKKIINLASAEYMAVINKKRLEADIVDIAFHENRDGKLKTISTFSKKARGMMAHYIIRNKITDFRQLKHFSSENYRYEERLSDENHFVFVR